MNGIPVYCRSDFLHWGTKIEILFTFLVAQICVPNLDHRPQLNSFAVILVCDTTMINHKPPVVSYMLLLHSGL